MPWSADDADKHKKGLSDDQKKKWAKIANRILADSGDEGKAIRIANSQVSKALVRKVAGLEEPSLAERAEIAKHLIGGHDQEKHGVWARTIESAKDKLGIESADHGRSQHKELRQKKKKTFDRAFNMSQELEDKALTDVARDVLQTTGIPITHVVPGQRREMIEGRYANYIKDSPEYQRVVQEMLDAKEAYNPRAAKSRGGRARRWGAVSEKSKPPREGTIADENRKSSKKLEDEALSFGKRVEEVKKHLIGMHDQDKHGQHARSEHGSFGTPRISERDKEIGGTAASLGTAALFLGPALVGGGKAAAGHVAGKKAAARRAHPEKLPTDAKVKPKSSKLRDLASGPRSKVQNRQLQRDIDEYLGGMF